MNRPFIWRGAKNLKNIFIFATFKTLKAFGPLLKKPSRFDFAEYLKCCIIIEVSLNICKISILPNTHGAYLL